MFRQAAWLVVILGVSLAWGDSATRPSGRAFGRGGPERAMRGGPMDRWEVDWEEAFAFFQKHSPLRAAAFLAMDEAAQLKFRPAIVARYRFTKWLTREDPDLQKLKEQQMEIEDRIFGLNQEIKKVQTDPALLQQKKMELRQAAAELVQRRLEERRLRLKRLEDLLNLERDRLRQDESETERMVDEVVRHVEDRGEAIIEEPPWGPPPGRPDKGPERGQR